jgi:hypothetical protein
MKKQTRVAISLALATIAGALFWLAQMANLVLDAIMKWNSLP